MPSVVDVCNTALDRNGEPPIISLLDGTPAANLCDRLFPIARDEVQRTFPWRRLRKRVSLAADPTAPIFGFDFRYRIPADSLRIIDVLDSQSRVVQEWELEGQFILTDTDAPLFIRYIATSNDPNEWDALMVSAVAARLAVELAEPLTQDTGKRNLLLAEYQNTMRQARNASAQEGSGQPLDLKDSWANSRFGSWF